MGSATKALILLTVGFALGVGVSQALRRQDQPQRVVFVSPPEDAMLPPVPLPPTPDSPTVDPERPSPVPSRKDQLSTGRPAPTDPAMVKFGRREKPDFEGVLKSATWEEFYKRAVELKKPQIGPGDEFERMVFRRVIQELGVDEATAKALRELFEAEQVAVTKTIYESYGSAAGFDAVRERLGSEWQTIYEDWRQRRETIRQANEPRFLKLLRYDQLATFNEHLRNTEIVLSCSFGSDGTYHLITGVGKKPN